MSKTIAVIRGDGIGPEIMRATLRVLDALTVDLKYDFVEAGMAALERLLPDVRRVESLVDGVRLLTS